MKAVICVRHDSPDGLQVKEIDKPIPKDDELLVRIKATTVTVADSRLRKFMFPSVMRVVARLLWGLKLPKPKYDILGMDFAGEVVSTGRAVRKFKVGDRLFRNLAPTRNIVAFPKTGRSKERRKRQPTRKLSLSSLGDLRLFIS